MCVMFCVRYATVSWVGLTTAFHVGEGEKGGGRDRGRGRREGKWSRGIQYWLSII